MPARHPASPTLFEALGAQMFPIRHVQGRLGELAEASVRLAVSDDNRSAWRAAAALALVEDGRPDDARELVLAEDLPSIPADPGWSIAMLYWAEVYTMLGDRNRAGSLYELLQPFSGQVVVSGPMVYGAIDSALGMFGKDNRAPRGRRSALRGIRRDRRASRRTVVSGPHACRPRPHAHRAREDRGPRLRNTDAQRLRTPAERPGGGLVTREARECRAALAAISG